MQMHAVLQVEGGFALSCGGTLQAKLSFLAFQFF